MSLNLSRPRRKRVHSLGWLRFISRSSRRTGGRSALGINSKLSRQSGRSRVGFHVLLQQATLTWVIHGRSIDYHRLVNWWEFRGHIHSPSGLLSAFDLSRILIHVGCIHIQDTFLIFIFTIHGHHLCLHGTLLQSERGISEAGLRVSALV